MAAGCGAERHVADFDVGQKLQLALAARPRGFDKFETRLGRERQLFRVDPNDLFHAGHADNGSVRGGARCQGMIAAHRPDRARIAVGISENRLDFGHRALRHELARGSGTAAIIILDHIWHLSPPRMTIGAVPGPRRQVPLSPLSQRPDRAHLRPLVSPTSRLRPARPGSSINAIETAYEGCRKHVVSATISASFSAVWV